ncbi:ImmA/IrrE family metallo-endopeptidase [Listeria monocytogenes]|uniref:ImmA/IrrE family metallo-endopeptidase n=1 Tax=Listeria monocytogenes TaxID=1639 RepID=UPI00190A6904|nr:ImmA/IrrE family metallo-endopeptidase [Listeria monocytogenes]EHL2721194.1 ImmA/IrrE family metallo-endopeptidase [Listeria monocytogenes]EJE1865002.1 ImmA/IrrE family metallo-endopeptidase [Listeria monocytogenes]EKH1409673.1 ImmA/IrrE family metallo-endopeptidase [Listeria monocytogenes]EKM3237835.1 ImmA/IrrE family metallo-endopeptidase [Listeria monocytogenes]EKZ0590777.1 ImmA/IrrE family metallo-endopeptidase [Listeria monocytogenes]
MKEARRFRQLSIPQLAEKVDISKQMISKYEHNDAQPSPKTYQKLVLALGFPLSFFQQGDEFSYDDLGTFYRSRLSSTQSEKKPSELLKKYLAVLANFFESYVDFPVLKELSHIEDPIASAQFLRKEWELGSSPIPNVLHLLEIQGFQIAAINSNSEKVDAFGSQTKVNGKDYYCILIDQDNNSFYRQQFSLAHELGHWMLHSKSINPQELEPQEYREMEKQANIFASNFLLPEEAFSKDIRGYEDDLDAYLKLKSKWEVSAASMVYRSKSLGLISSEQYLRLQKRMSSRGWRRSEPFDSVHSVPKPTIMKQAYELLVQANIIGNNTLAELLNRQYGISLPNDILAELLGISLDALSDSNKGKIVQMKKN